MASKDFPVGSIVYFLHNKTERVLPAQVYEKIVRTSLDGSKATYIISVQSKDNIKKIEVDPESVHIFQTPEEMKDFMVSRATEAVCKLVDSAVKVSEIFGVTPKQPDQLEDPEGYESWHTPAADRPLGVSPNKKSKVEQITEVDLGNGQTGRLKV
tara:strand:- start:33 stop:497 length:465 start_codon:yes stop_codon:yes gene_type:complete